MGMRLRAGSRSGAGRADRSSPRPGTRAPGGVLPSEEDEAAGADPTEADGGGSSPALRPQPANASASANTATANTTLRLSDGLTTALPNCAAHIPQRRDLARRFCACSTTLRWPDPGLSTAREIGMSAQELAPEETIVHDRQRERRNGMSFKSNVAAGIFVELRRRCPWAAVCARSRERGMTVCLSFPCRAASATFSPAPARSSAPCRRSSCGSPRISPPTVPTARPSRCAARSPASR